MKFPLIYSLPPAGQKISLSKIWGSWNFRSEPSSSELWAPLSNYLGVKYLLFLNSGRAALWLLLKTLSRIQPWKKEIIIPAYTCPAVVSAVLKSNLTPVLCDNNFEDFGLSIKELEKKVNKDTLAVIVVHLLGYPANIMEAKEICENMGVYVIEDGAQCFGNTLMNSHGPKMGTIADAGFFSFGRGKPLSILRGGILVTQSEVIFQEALKIYNELNTRKGENNISFRLLLSFYSIFSNPYLYWIPQRIPFLHLGETIFEPEFNISQGSEFIVYLLNEILRKFEEEKEIRKNNSKWYFENLKINSFGRDTDYPYLRFPLFLENKQDRDNLLHQITSQGTGAALFYPCPLNELKGLKEILNDNHLYPNAQKIADTLITLPIHSGVSSKIREKIKSTLNSFL